MSGGGYKKIKLYKDDIAYEYTCPCPYAIFLIPGFGCVFPVTCPIFFSLRGKTFLTRKPYRELKSVEYVTGGGCCCCCGDSYYIEGLTKGHNEMQDQKTMKEMVSDITQAMAQTLAQKSFSATASASVSI